MTKYGKHDHLKFGNLSVEAVEVKGETYATLVKDVDGAWNNDNVQEFCEKHVKADAETVYFVNGDISLPFAFFAVMNHSKGITTWADFKVKYKPFAQPVLSLNVKPDAGDAKVEKPKKQKLA